MLSLKRALVARPTASDSFILDDDIFYFCFIKKTVLMLNLDVKVVLFCKPKHNIWLQYTCRFMLISRNGKPLKNTRGDANLFKSKKINRLG